MTDLGVVVNDPAYLSRLETGDRKRIPDPEPLAALAGALGTTSLDLLRYLGYGGDAEPEPVDDNDPELVFTRLERITQQSGLEAIAKREILDTIHWARRRSRREGG